MNKLYIIYQWTKYNILDKLNRTLNKYVLFNKLYIIYQWINYNILDKLNIICKICKYIIHNTLDN